MDKPPVDNPVAKHMARVPLYIRVGFGMFILFGMLGNCAGHREQSVLVFVVVSLMWCCLRILTEAVEAYRILSLAKQHDAVQKKDDKGDDKQGPPPPVAPV
jgi:hypothetical protein